MNLIRFSRLQTHDKKLSSSVGQGLQVSQTLDRSRYLKQQQVSIPAVPADGGKPSQMLLGKAQSRLAE